MKKYKVEFIQTETFIVDVLAETEQEATDIGTEKWEHIKAHGMSHYHQIGDTETSTGTIYDVSGTDDPFNP